MIARARPDARPLAAELLARLLGDLGDAAGPPVYLHGDANLRNAICDDDRVTLIDFEDASAGPAAADLGQLLARLRVARVIGRLSPTSEDALAAALLDGYAEIQATPTARSLRWHTGASVLARAVLPAVSRVRPSLLVCLQPLLESA